MPEIYMFFDKDKLPIAVFLQETPEKAISLCEKLYRKPWQRLVEEDGFSVSKESEVPQSEWDRIGDALHKPAVSTTPRAKASGASIDCVAAMRYARTHYLENQK